MIKHYIMELIKQYGNIGVAIGLFLEFLGLPVPGESLMAFIGYSALKSNSSILVPTIYAIIGTYIGSVFAYVLGYRYGENLLVRYGKYIFITKEKLEKTQKLISKDKKILLLFSRYIMGVRHITPYLCGISRVKLSTFLLYNFWGSIIWCVFFIGFGNILGHEWIIIERLVKSYFLIFIIIAVFVFGVIKYFGKHKGVIFLTAFPLLIFIKLSEDLLKKELSNFDDIIYNFISRFISKDLTALMTCISFLGSGVALIILSLIIYLILIKYKKYSRYPKLIIFNLVLTWVLNEIFKMIFHRQRPDILRMVDVTGYSFPSGHSMVSVSFYGLLIYFCYINIDNRWRRYSAVLFLSILIISIGISRIYLGVHYASDVLAGFSAGFAWLVVFIVIINKFYLKEKNSTVL